MMIKRILLITILLTLPGCTSPSRDADNQLDRADNRTAHQQPSIGSDPLKNALNFAETGNWLVEPKIVGGAEARAGDDPWQVALVAAERTDGNFAFCGGSIVRPNWILSAAHCVDKGTSPSQVDVVSGTVDLDNGGTRSRVAEIIIHRDWDPSSHNNDIALLRLAGTASGQPVGIPSAAVESRATQPGTNVRVTGWGRTSQGGTSVRRLRTVDMPIVSRSDCNDRVSYNGGITDNMICAGRQQGGSDSCQGDSGGPLTGTAGANRALLGIVSFGEGCAKPNKYGVYTRAGNYGGWVDSCIAGQKCIRQ
jgi:secreted trypsin-like serine protease